MADLATRQGFTREALDDVARSDPPSIREVRLQSFERFEATPLPSPETEEWRYTDLAGLDLSRFIPRQPEPQVRTLDEVPDAVLAAAGAPGERSALSIQHNSTSVIAHMDRDHERWGWKSVGATGRGRRAKETVCLYLGPDQWV